MIRRFHEAKVRGDKSVTPWGPGAPRREFLYSEDMAAACVHLMDMPKAGMAWLVKNETPPLINVGCGTDLAISQLAELVRKIIGTNAVMEWDTTKPDGTPRKLLDVGKLAALGWKQAIGLEDGIRTSNRSGVVGGSVRSSLG